ncbi:DDE-type integrase/transposase/recombinase [Labilibaculum euxinus]
MKQERRTFRREFKVAQQGKVWILDITYIRTLEGELYLTVIIGLADRKIIGCAISRSMRACETVAPAWLMAIRNRPIHTKLIFRSDSGVQ